MIPARNLTYAVPDLHGRYDLLDMAIAAMVFDAGLRRAERRTAVFLGDYVDRGPDSRGVIERLLSAPPHGWRWICLAGNHDTSMLQACYGSGSGSKLENWFKNGARSTLASYGEVSTAWPFTAVPAAHLVWLAGLPSLHQNRYRVFVHGGLDPALPLDAQSDDVLQRKRYPDNDPGHHPAGHVVHGHKSNPDGPLLFAGRTALDTMAWRTGRLVLGVFDDDRPGGPIDLIEVKGAPALAGAPA